LSLAARSVSSTNPNVEMDSYGLKVNVFNSKGSEFTVAYSENDFGSYTEFAIEQQWRYRHKVGMGATVFKLDSGDNSIPNIIPVTDIDFLFLNYTYAISRLFHGFIELSDINYLDQGSENALLGLKLVF